VSVETMRKSEARAFYAYGVSRLSNREKTDSLRIPLPLTPIPKFLDFYNLIGFGSKITMATAEREQVRPYWNYSGKDRMFMIVRNRIIFQAEITD